MNEQVQLTKIDTYPIVTAVAWAIQILAIGLAVYLVIVGCYLLWRMIPESPLKTCPHLCERCNLLDEKARQIYREKIRD